MTTLGALWLAFMGFSTLALAMSRHHRDLFGKTPSRFVKFVLQIAGWSLLALSLAICLNGSGLAIGSTLWLGLTTAAILVVAFTLALASSKS